MRSLILLLSLILLSSSQAYRNEPQCKSKKGNCMLAGKCRGGIIKDGACPRQPANVKCCLAVQEEPCKQRKGFCQWTDQTCKGEEIAGLCPSQSKGVLCCVEKCEDKYEHALKEILKFEGKCQNDPNDAANTYDGHLGYTCMGITPQVGWVNRLGYYGICAKHYRGLPAMFLKHCYDRFHRHFVAGTKNIYKKKYLTVCKELEDPAFFVCSDIAVNSGVGRVKRFMKVLGRPETDNVKEYARELNNLHKSFYKQIAERNPKLKKFLKGWLRRAHKRKEFIDNYKC